MQSYNKESPKLADSNKIIFSYDFNNFQYNISFYRAKMSKNKLPKHELMSFFKNMYLKVNDFQDLKGLSSSLIKTIILSLTLFVIGLFISAYGYFFISNSWLILAGFCLVIIACTYIFAFKLRQKRVRAEILLRTRSCINEFLCENSNNFEKKKVKWNLPTDHFDWIELYVEDNMEFPIVSDSLNFGRKGTEGDKLMSDCTAINIMASTELNDKSIEL